MVSDFMYLQLICVHMETIDDFHSMISPFPGGQEYNGQLSPVHVFTPYLYKINVNIMVPSMSRSFSLKFSDYNLGLT
jgi:hypothetical protein